MKKLFRILYCLCLLTCGILLNSCNNPAPTELVQDNPSVQNQIQVEVVTKDPTDEYYNNGFDTTGVANPVMNYSNIINVSGIKTTINNITTKISFAQAIFYNRNMPIREPGGRLIGYQTVTPGRVKFNNILAMTIPYRIRFNNHGMHADTNLGNMFALTRGMMGQFNFDYNSSINFQFIPMQGHAVNFDIPTPKEIIGKVILSGNIRNKTLNCLLNWDKGNPNDSIEIILGAITTAKNSDGTYSILPLYKMKTRDTGKLLIPARLVNEIPQSKFNKLVLTFVRKYQIHFTGSGNDLFVLSQSIHSITLDIP